MNINIKKFLTRINFFSKNGISSKTFKNKNRGFTLVELLVTITVFVIVTGVVLVNSNKFDSSILLHDFAYDVALTVKEAQSYGVNVKENISGTFNTAYGVYFDTTQSITNFVLFNDTGNATAYTGNPTGGPDNIYNGSLTSCPTNDPECVQKYSMTRGTYIQSICAGASDLSCNQADQLSILFKRPNLDALIYYKVGSNPLSGLQPYAKIVLSASNGATSTVIVTSIGQIYVKR